MGQRVHAYLLCGPCLTDHGLDAGRKAFEPVLLPTYITAVCIQPKRGGKTMKHGANVIYLSTHLSLRHIVLLPNSCFDVAFACS